MDQEIIDRVSKAILETPNASDYKILVAKRATEAMREPTDKMIKAALHDFMYREKNKMPWNARTMYKAMIDAILGT